MALIKCPECGKEISDRSEKCPNCGCPIQNNANQIQKQNPVEGKTSGSSVAALILSVLGCTFVIGAILAIIDLCKKDGRKKTCSVIALVICGIWFIIGVTNMENSEESGNSTQQSSSVSMESDKKEENATQMGLEENSGGEENQKEENEESIEDEITLEEVKSQEKELNYKDVMRNPDDYVGQYFAVKVKILTVENGSWFSGYEKAYKSFTNDEYDLWMGDMIYLLDNRDQNSEDCIKILEDDIVLIHGKFNGLVETKNALNGTSGEEMSLEVLYVEIISE